jgi:ribonucleotide reductase beta subunit family protein with ferritin-like domain
MITLYSKNACNRCDEAEYFVHQHNVKIYKRIKVNGMNDIVKNFEHLEDELLGISYFPVFHVKTDNDEHMYDFETFKKLFGEELLIKNDKRYVIFPINYPIIWEMYEMVVASFWTEKEIDLSKDEFDWENKLNDNDRFFIKQILAFFAGADGIVNENLSLNFSNEIQIPEARAFYSYQQFNETIHNHTYSLMIDKYIKSPIEREKLLDGIHTIASVNKKANWTMKWMDKKTQPFVKRLIAFACVEGIMFSGSFCALFWLKKRGLLHGLTFSNELISRDEGLHQDFAVLLFSYLKNKPTQLEVEEIVKDAVEHEKEFIIESIPCNLIGMNSSLMSQYIEYVADRLLLQLNYKPIWNSQNPFDFMEMISLSGKTNFFEKRVGEYKLAGSMVKETENAFKLDADF